MNPYSELIEKIETCADAFLRDQRERDYQIVQYEKQKILLLIIILINAWIMFYLLWSRFDDVLTTQHPQPQSQIHDDGVERETA